MNMRRTTFIRLFAGIAFIIQLHNIQTTHASGIDDDIFLKHFKLANEGSDELSSRQTRRVRLYSKVTGKHLQIIGKKVTALGDADDEYSKLLFISDSLGGRVRIKGEKSKFYLCVTPSGKLVGRRRFLSNRCAFREGYTVKYYNTFSNVAHPNWYISFNRRGRPKRGPRTSRHDTGSLFVKRSPPKPTQTTPLDEALKKLEEEIREKYRRSMYERSWRRIRRHRFASETPKWTRQTLSTERRTEVEPPSWLFAPASDMSPQVKMEWLQNVNMYLDDMQNSNMGFPTAGPYTYDQITRASEKRNKKTKHKKKHSRNNKKRKSKSPRRKRKRQHKTKRKDNVRVEYITTRPTMPPTTRTFDELLDNLRGKLDDGNKLKVPKTHKLFNSTYNSRNKSRTRKISKRKQVHR